MGDLQRREFHEALLDADSVEDLPGKWQATIVAADQSRPDQSTCGSSIRISSIQMKDMVQQSFYGPGPR